MVCGSLGCHDSSPPPQSRSVSGLQGKLDAALAIREITRRDDALASVAEEAGDAGDVEVAKGALKAMSELTRHDRAAAASALKLADHGMTGEATEVAKTIKEITKRDATLSQIAKGKSSK